jgi:hypothetical protein
VKVIVAGSRNLTDAKLVVQAIKESGFEITELFSGGARGADRLAEAWAKKQTPPIPVRRFPALWEKQGLNAGPIRNRAMAFEADALIALWNGTSPGTRDMILVAKQKNLPTFVFRTDRA